MTKELKRFAEIYEAAKNEIFANRFEDEVILLGYKTEYKKRFECKCPVRITESKAAEILKKYGITVEEYIKLFKIRSDIRCNCEEHLFAIDDYIVSPEALEIAIEAEIAAASINSEVEVKVEETPKTTEILKKATSKESMWILTQAGKCNRVVLKANNGKIGVYTTTKTNGLLKENTIAAIDADDAVTQEANAEINNEVIVIESGVDDDGSNDDTEENQMIVNLSDYDDDDELIDGPEEQIMLYADITDAMLGLEKQKDDDSNKTIYRVDGKKVMHKRYLEHRYYRRLAKLRETTEYKFLILASKVNAKLQEIEKKMRIYSEIQKGIVYNTARMVFYDKLNIAINEGKFDKGALEYIAFNFVGTVHFYNDCLEDFERVKKIGNDLAEFEKLQNELIDFEVRYPVLVSKIAESGFYGYELPPSRDFKDTSEMCWLLQQKGDLPFTMITADIWSAIHSRSIYNEVANMDLTPNDKVKQYCAEYVSDIIETPETPTDPPVGNNDNPTTFIIETPEGYQYNYAVNDELPVKQDNLIQVVDRNGNKIYEYDDVHLAFAAVYKITQLYQSRNTGCKMSKAMEGGFTISVYDTNIAQEIFKKIRTKLKIYGKALLKPSFAMRGLAYFEGIEFVKERKWNTYMDCKVKINLGAAILEDTHKEIISILEEYDKQIVVIEDSYKIS